MAATKKTVSIPQELNVGPLTNAGTGGVGNIVQVPSAIAISDKLALRIHAIHYFTNNARFRMQAITDGDLRYGFSFLAVQPAGGFTNLSPGVVDYNELRMNRNALTGVGFAWKFHTDPDVVDLHIRHPQGILVHPANLYFWNWNVTALDGSCSIWAKIWYNVEEISQDEWDELWKQMFVTQAG